jgi:hypothetical protein
MITRTRSKDRQVPRAVGPTFEGFYVVVWNHWAGRYLDARDYGYKAWPVGKRR